MAYKKTEKTLAGDIPIELFDVFDKQTMERKQPKKAAISSAIKLWTELPSEIQAQILEQSFDIKSVLLLYIVAEPELKDGLKKIITSEPNIEEARIEARKLLRKTIVNAWFQGFVFTEEDKKILLRQFAISDMAIKEKKKFIDGINKFMDTKQSQKVKI
jgi:hypothetical protein